MKNRGIELSLSARVLEGKRNGLSWNADFTAAHNTNELTSITPFGGQALKILVGGIAGGVGTTIQVLQPGVPINSFYVYEHKSVKRQADLRGRERRPRRWPPNGTINDQDLYVDQNGDGVINQTTSGRSTTPRRSGSSGIRRTWPTGNLDLGFTLRAYLGNYIYNNVASNLGNYPRADAGSPYNLHSSVLETNFAHASSCRTSTSRMRPSCGWTTSRSATRSTCAASRRGSSVPCRTLFTITGYSGVDPSANIARARPRRRQRHRQQHLSALPHVHRRPEPQTVSHRPEHSRRNGAMNRKPRTVLTVAAALLMLGAAGCTDTTELPNEHGHRRQLLQRSRARTVPSSRRSTRGLAVSGQQGPAGNGRTSTASTRASRSTSVSTGRPRSCRPTRR